MSVTDRTTAALASETLAFFDELRALRSQRDRDSREYCEAREALDARRAELVARIKAGAR